MSSSNFDQLSVLYSKIEKTGGNLDTRFSGGIRGGIFRLPPPHWAALINYHHIDYGLSTILEVIPIYYHKK